MSHQALVWIDQDECMGAGTCEQIAPAVFKPIGDGQWGVAESYPYFTTPTTFSGRVGPGEAPGGFEGRARVPDELMEAVVDAVAECPGECIYLEPRH